MKKITYINLLLVLFLLSCDPEETFQDHLYQRTFSNDTDWEIVLIYHRLRSSETESGATIVKDTLTLAAHTKKAGYFETAYSSEGINENNFKLIIEQNIKPYSTLNQAPKFELYVASEFKKEWKGTTAYLGNKIHSPYNYDSWELITYDKVLKPSYGLFIYGEILFTINDADLE